MRPSPLKPPVRALRARPLHTSGERAALTGTAIEELFRSAEVLTEGCLSGPPGGETWFGSVMLTFRLDGLLGGPVGDEDPRADALVRVIEGSVRVRLLAHRIACAEVHTRYPDRQVGTAHIESRFRRVGSRLLLDVDLEAPVEVASSERRAR